MATWEDFATTSGCHVRSLAVWANGLFMGTEPDGCIYVHNFTTGNFYKMVQTEDHAVMAMAEYNGKLYAGTSPRGVVYVFDGTAWHIALRAPGIGITSMVVYGGLLYVGAKGLESPLVYDGTSWSLADYGPLTSGSSQSGTGVSSQDIFNPSGPQKIVVSSARGVDSNPYLISNFKEVWLSALKSVPVALADGSMTDQDSKALRPPNPDVSISALTADSSLGVLSGGGTKCAVYRHAIGAAVKQIFGSDASPVSAAANVDSGVNLVAAGDTLYLLKQGDDNSSSGE